MRSNLLPLPIALMWIIGSTFIVTGSTYSLWKMLRQHPSSHAYQEAVVVRKIVQTGPHTDTLSTDALAEIMELSSDHPTHTAVFDFEEATQKLLHMPVIKEARVEPFLSDTIYVDYTMRQPIAMMYDYENVAIDEEGYAFPFSPFFSPKELPEVYFGLAPTPNALQIFQEPIEGKQWTLALHILKMLKTAGEEAHIRVRRIDVSHAFAESLGRQEIVIELASEEGPLLTASTRPFLHRLRLHPQDYQQQLGNYFVLYRNLLDATPQGPAERMIDLRMGGLAFVQGTEQPR